MARHRGWFEFVLLAVEPYLPDVTRRLMFVRGRGLREREGGREREAERWGECGLAGMDGMARIEGRGKTAVFSCVWLTARLHWCATPPPPAQSPYPIPLHTNTLTNMRFLVVGVFRVFWKDCLECVCLDSGK